MTGNVNTKRFRRNKSSPLMTEINVTPFVDVMLVLLIIFMVTAPLMQTGVNVDLPQEDVGSLEIQDENVVSIRKDGAIFYNEKRLTEKDLFNKLKSLASVSSSAEVFLRADKTLPYGTVMNVTGIIKKAGIGRLGMVTEVSPVSGKKKTQKKG
ncbi:Tol biopolymer transport system, TolR protein [hydrothermal vent metagenome]|uniref:Tol biopolymer transport system, TolR protein n=1 Tax=hydrothermal vent metagenome TaxID=652676 RepID=A0A3B1CBC1_9ZZZZ